VWFLVLAICIFSILLFCVHKKQKSIEKFLQDNEILKIKMRKFYGKLLEKGDKYNIPYPMYYLNMDKDSDRKENLLQEHKTYVNSKLTRILGFNGNAINNTSGDTVSYGSESISFENYYTELSKGEIGCLLSHLIAIYTSWNNGDEIALICEDDISFCTTSFIHPLEEVVGNAPVNWECIQLSGFTDNYENTPSSNLQYIRRNYPNLAFWSCGAYIINRKGMEKILKVVKKNKFDNLYSIRPVRDATLSEINEFKMVKSHINSKVFPLYGVADAYIYDLVNTYAIYPSLFIVNNSKFDSTFHADHTPYHLKTTLTNIKNLEDAYSI
jgi:GR25 family glycosyltransferase involved in LPS biosynthesis